MILPLSEFEVSALLVSLRSSLLGVMMFFPLAMMIAIAQHHVSTVPRLLLKLLFNLPLYMSPVAVGYLLLICLGPTSAMGVWLFDNFSIELAFTSLGAAIAIGLTTLPFQLQALGLSLSAIDPKLLQSAASLGAGPLDRFVSIYVPLMRLGIVTALLTSFTAGLGEFGAVIAFAANIPGVSQGLPQALYSSLQTPDGDVQSLRLMLSSLLVALGGFALAELIASRWQISKL